MTQDPYSPFSQPNTPENLETPADDNVSPVGGQTEADSTNHLSSSHGNDSFLQSPPANPYSYPVLPQSTPYSGAAPAQQNNPYGDPLPGQQSNAYAGTPPSQQQSPYGATPPTQANSYQSEYSAQYPPPYGYQAPGQQPYGNWVLPVATPEQEKSPILGVVAAVLGIGTLLTSTGIGVWMGQVFSALIVWSVESGYADFSDPTSPKIDTNYLPEYFTAPIASAVVIGMLLTIVGIAALIVGALAIAQKRGKGLGVISIIASIAAPIVGFTITMVMLMGTIGSIG